jgi:hypothetical protein
LMTDWKVGSRGALNGRLLTPIASGDDALRPLGDSLSGRSDVRGGWGR